MCKPRKEPTWNNTKSKISACYLFHVSFLPDIFFKPEEKKTCYSKMPVGFQRSTRLYIPDIKSPWELRNHGNFLPGIYYSQSTLPRMVLNAVHCPRVALCFVRRTAGSRLMSDVLCTSLVALILAIHCLMRIFNISIPNADKTKNHWGQRGLLERPDW
jgi:hypothetical protein